MKLNIVLRTYLRSPIIPLLPHENHIGTSIDDCCPHRHSNIHVPIEVKHHEDKRQGCLFRDLLHLFHRQALERCMDIVFQKGWLFHPGCIPKLVLCYVRVVHDVYLAPSVFDRSNLLRLGKFDLTNGNYRSTNNHEFRTSS